MLTEIVDLNLAEVFTPEQPRPCDSHPCGPNAHCRVNPNSGSAACVCPPDYHGDPYMSCRPECAANSDCPRHRTCLNNRCVDPCAGVCGLESLCRVVNHLPVCGCPQGYTGDPYSLCRPIPVLSKIAIDSGAWGFAYFNHNRKNRINCDMQRPSFFLLLSVL